MRFSELFKEKLFIIEVSYFFYILEFIIFVFGIYLGMTEDIIYIASAIFVVALLYTIKLLLQIKDDLSKELQTQKDKLSSIFINKNQSRFMFSPFISRINTDYLISLNVASGTAIKGPILRLEYPDLISTKNHVKSSTYENVGDNSGHKVMKDYFEFNHYSEENVCVVKIMPIESQMERFYQYQFQVPCDIYKNISLSLVNGSGKHLSDVNFDWI
ncbi:hypothetical protein [Trichococcus shcherbakoviae]|uniref:Uncharacterized protein n=1 Tax=Trichococcus shcherbakoviae TaxID=2094020 RepID=A0A383TA88_9LACT|nr:hypothetical protein [Trichococcus shcherbakoviae]SYZ77240.1 Hypothetical protein TART1_0002 [Trichococcus shcherbakoviae]